MHALLMPPGAVSLWRVAHGCSGTPASPAPFCRSWDATAAPQPALLHEHVGHIDWVRRPAGGLVAADNCGCRQHGGGGQKRQAGLQAAGGRAWRHCQASLTAHPTHPMPPAAPTGERPGAGGRCARVLLQRQDPARVAARLAGCGAAAGALHAPGSLAGPAAGQRVLLSNCCSNQRLLLPLLLLCPPACAEPALGCLTGHSDYVTGLAASASTNMLASGGLRGEVLLWDLAALRRVMEGSAAVRGAAAAAFCPLEPHTWLCLAGRASGCSLADCCCAALRRRRTRATAPRRQTHRATRSTPSP